MVRIYGGKPIRAAVVHGGPGDIGGLACVARELGKTVGVAEPLQSRHTVEGLAEELREQLLGLGGGPVALLGHSWGAWLAILLAARCPELVEQLILVGCGPLKEAYVPQIGARRMDNLPPEERGAFSRLLARVAKTGQGMEELGRLVGLSDNVDPLPADREKDDPVDGEMYQKVWPEAAELRRSGALLEACARLRCPITLLHGTRDPHPLEGVTEPLAELGVAFHAVPFPDCGHSPFQERAGRERFYQIVLNLLK